MFSAFLAGVIPGLVLTVAIGPVFFMLISTSMRYGFRTSLRLEAGIISSDAVCIAIAYFGLQKFLMNPAYKEEISWIGGLILVGFGLHMMLKEHVLPKAGTEPIPVPNSRQLYVRGFLFNMSNPSVIFFWTAAVGLAITEFADVPLRIPFYFAGILCTVLCTDILKAYLADKIRRLLTPFIMLWLDRSAGLAIVSFGVVLILKQYVG